MFLRIQEKATSAAFWSYLCPCVVGAVGAAEIALAVPLRTLHRHWRSCRASDYLLSAFSPFWSELQPNLDDADADEDVGEDNGGTGAAAVDNDVEGEGEYGHCLYPCVAQSNAVDHHHSIPSILTCKGVVQGDGAGGADGAVPAMDDVVGIGPKFPSCLHRDQFPDPCAADKPIEYS